MAEHEEEEITLEEQIHILQEQGLPPEKIVEQILKEDINADVNILANTLKMDKMDIGRIKGRLSSAKKRRAAKVAPGTGKEAGEEEESLYKGELDTTRILKDILTKHPDIPSKVVDEVCSWAEFGPIHPTQLVSLLQSFRGITATTAYIIAQKYALALQKAQLEGKIQPIVIPGQLPSGSTQTLGVFSAGGMQQPGPQFGGQQLGQGSPYGMPGATYGISYGAPPDARSVANEVLRILDERKPKEKETAEAYVDIEEPVQIGGKIIVGDDEQPIMKKIHVPVSQAGLFAPREDDEARFLSKMKDYKDLFGKEGLTEEKIREIIREGRPAAPTESSEKPITLEDVKKVSSESAQAAVTAVVEAHEKEDKEEKRHKEVIAAIERSGSAKAVEGYREDSYRILGQGLQEGAGVLRDRHPLEVIIKDGGRVLFGGTPSEKEVEAGAGVGLLKRLKERGWVVEQ